MRTKGFTYLGVLFLISLLAMTAAAAGAVWSVAKQRDDERELVFIGRQFQAAIEHYRAASTDPAQPYPRQLEELLRDDRRLAPVHHLRRLYVDPMTGQANWGLIRLPDGGIVGVHSLSDRRPYPRERVVAGFSPPPSQSYRDWAFVAPSAVETLAALRAAESPVAPLPGGPSAAVQTSPSKRSAPSDRLPMPSEPEPVVPDTAAQVTPERAARPSQEDLRNRTPEACGRITAYDEQICQQVAGSLGEDAARTCRDSAVQRSVACTLGTSGNLPPLIRNAP